MRFTLLLVVMIGISMTTDLSAQTPSAELPAIKIVLCGDTFVGKSAINEKKNVVLETSLE